MLMKYITLYLLKPYFYVLHYIFWQKGDDEHHRLITMGLDGISRLVKIISDKAVHFQSGYLYHYAFVMLIGFSILLTYLILY